MNLLKLDYDLRELSNELKSKVSHQRALDCFAMTEPFFKILEEKGITLAEGVLIFTNILGCAIVELAKAYQSEPVIDAQQTNTTPYVWSETII